MSRSETMARSGALKKLLDMMDDEDGKEIKGLHPVAEMSVTKVSPLKSEDEGHDEDQEDEEPYTFGKTWDKPESEPGDADGDGDHDSAIEDLKAKHAAEISAHHAKRKMKR